MSSVLPDNGIHDDPELKLGKLPAKASLKALLFADFVDVPTQLPIASNFWTNRTVFPLGTWGNDRLGDCTRAKQAVAAMRFERLESRQTPIFTDDEVSRVYIEMSNRRYGGGDNGAYEEDALADWRNPDYTFRDTKGHPHTIDLFTRLDPKNPQQMKAAILLSGGVRGIALCFNLPRAAQDMVRRRIPWDVPEGQPLTGDWMPGSWGGHSMWARDYLAGGLWVPQTWNMPDQTVTWRFVMAYCDEAHSIVDSLDTWRARKASTSDLDAVNIEAMADAVNQVSDVKVRVK